MLSYCHDHIWVDFDGVFPILFLAHLMEMSAALEKSKREIHKPHSKCQGQCFQQMDRSPRSVSYAQH
jgi:hypothetical protein